MIPGAWQPLKCMFQNSHGLGGGTFRVRHARVEIPQLPGRAVHQGLCIDARDIQIFPVGFVNGFHRFREAIVEGLVVFDFRICGITRRQGLDQRTLHRPGLLQCLCGGQRCMCSCQRRPLFLRREDFPGLVVIRTDTVSDAPVS